MACDGKESDGERLKKDRTNGLNPLLVTAARCWRRGSRAAEEGSSGILLCPDLRGPKDVVSDGDLIEGKRKIWKENTIPSLGGLGLNAAGATPNLHTFKVHHVLSDFSHHAISDNLPAKKHMLPSADLLGARLYYLLPLTVPPPPKKPANENQSKKRVRFSEDVKSGSDGPAEVAAPAGTVRIKLVISKQELRAMLSQEEVLVD
ncbi:NAD(P)H-quinone oxidoreductase subunit 1 [Striga asiatica]|uniref:NAD(P)H-quinone oxidoreductase subunit 1 n=1 Tax=Striga asiatica TaxID=4170 RepID=A0A5A7QEE5_STRAF|nr:NAD(P)H-quinone oxidoreductase subunit 1 [Striga asiatica]